MASQIKRTAALPATTSSSNKEGILARVSSSVSQSSIVNKGIQVASNAKYVTKKLAKSTGKAAWYFGTTVLIICVPYLIVMDGEQQATEMEMQHAALLGTPPAS